MAIFKCQQAWITVFILIFYGVTMPAASQNQSDNDAAAVRSSTIYEMSPAEFFNLEQAQKPIDLENVDHELLSAAVFHASNRQRYDHDKEMLGHDPKLDRIARKRAQTMADEKYLSHINPDDQDRRTPLDRVEAAGLDPRFVAENIATHFGIRYESGQAVFTEEKDGQTVFRYTTRGKPIPNHTYKSFAQTLVQRWMNSAGHRRNLLSTKAASLGNGCVQIENRSAMSKFVCAQVFFDSP